MPICDYTELLISSRPHAARAYETKKPECYRPFPFKGKARIGMGSFATLTPIPSPTLPLKGRESVITQVKLILLNSWGFA